MSRTVVGSLIVIFLGSLSFLIPVDEIPSPQPVVITQIIETKPLMMKQAVFDDNIEDVSPLDNNKQKGGERKQVK